MEIFAFCLIAIVVVVIALLVSPRRAKSEELWDAAFSEPNFKIYKRYRSFDTGIAIDAEALKLRLYTLTDKSIKYRTFSAKDILGCEIIEDGHSTTSVSRGSQVGGAIVGGLLLGGIGAVVGGLTGKKETTKVVNQIDLKITVNSLKRPIHTVCVMRNSQKKTHPNYKELREAAMEWCSTIEVLINSSEKAKSTALAADELTKLANLRDKGVLTEEEFQAQKEKILSF